MPLLILCASFFIDRDSVVPLVQGKKSGISPLLFVGGKFRSLFYPPFDRPGRWNYFLNVLLVGFIPWTLMIPVVLMDVKERLRDDKTVFLLLWTGLPLLFFFKVQIATLYSSDLSRPGFAHGRSRGENSCRSDASPKVGSSSSLGHDICAADFVGGGDPLAESCTRPRPSSLRVCLADDATRVHSRPGIGLDRRGVGQLENMVGEVGVPWFMLVAASLSLFVEPGDGAGLSNPFFQRTCARNSESNQLRRTDCLL